HVIDGATNITVVLKNKTEYKGRVIGKDKITDLAVIKIEADKDIPTLSFGEASSIQVGSFAIAVGNPFGLSGSFTFGVISATGRTGINIDRNAAFKHFIQTDASINQGNSGGPLLNIKGEVIGINTAIYSTTGRGSVGIGFAVPATTAKHVIRQLIDKGRVDRGYIGVQPKDLDPAMAKHFKLESNKGVIVQRVLADGPAHKAGIETGDIILSVNGEGVKDTIHLIDLISHIQPGEKAKLKILRKGKSMQLTINLGKRPGQIVLSEKVMEEEKEKTSEDSWLGLSFGMTQDSRTGVPKLVAKNEVVITGIEKNSPASLASKPLQVDDILESINSYPIQDMDSLEKVIKRIKGEKSFIFAFLRKGQRIFTVIQARSKKR
ncbi:MAG TPA: PDZ domain-containing protein, partial [Spirochaetes bacterium]|nr:PDZ domain-containing protein [Spirochaetota bacterium]